MQKNVLLSLSLLFSLGFFIFQSTLATFSNSGSITGAELNISADCYENNGTMDGNKIKISAATLKGSGPIRGSYTNIQCDHYNLNSFLSGTHQCIIKAKIFEANGTIEGNKVTIICDEFKFSGTIAAQECIIYTKNKFDHTLFKRNTNGKYTIHITKKGFEPSTHKNRISNAFQNLKTNFLHLADENIEDEIQKVISYANLNNIYDIVLLTSFMQEAEEMAIYNRERQNKNRGSDSDLYAAIACGSLGAIGITGAIAAILYPNLITRKFNLKNKEGLVKYASIAAGCSVCSLLLSYLNLSEWLNPRYKEKYEKLSLIASQLNHALIRAHIPEEEIIALQ